MFFSQNLKNNKGFSLVELLVVMTIMITLGAIGYQAMSGNKVIARDTARKEALGNLQDALENYYAKNNFYPQPSTRYARDGTNHLQDTYNREVINYSNVWGFRPYTIESEYDPNPSSGIASEDINNSETLKEALPSCKLVWDNANNTVDEFADIENFACGGLIYDRSGRVVIGWKGGLNTFSGKNSATNPKVLARNDKDNNNDDENRDYYNPINGVDRDLISSAFDESYFSGSASDPSLSNIPSLKDLGIGNFVYSAYRKGINIYTGANTDIGASQYQITTTLENSEDLSDQTAYVIGNYIRKKSSHNTKIGSEGSESSVKTFLPYSLIGSRNAITLNEQKIDEAPSFSSCPENDSYSENIDEIEMPCDIDGPFDWHYSDIDFDGTDNESGYMGVPYPVIF